MSDLLARGVHMQAGMVGAENGKLHDEHVTAMEMRRLRRWRNGIGQQDPTPAGAALALASACQTHSPAATDPTAFACDWSLESKGDPA
jgi:hypothetical protein